ncbi:MAG TPA: hypothetical protein VF943_09335, partial [Burkholderiales bacterium]
RCGRARQPSAAVLAVTLGAPLPITSERLQSGRTRGPARRADQALKWQRQGASDREPSVMTTMTSNATVSRKRWKSGSKKPFPASDAVAVIEGADHHPTGSRDLEHL